MAADETATNYADITNQLIADAANAEAQRDTALRNGNNHIHTDKNDICSLPVPDICPLVHVSPGNGSSGAIASCPPQRYILINIQVRKASVRTEASLITHA